jgi:hypothetical protein
LLEEAVRLIEHIQFNDFALLIEAIELNGLVGDLFVGRQHIAPGADVPAASGDPSHNLVVLLNEIVDGGVAVAKGTVASRPKSCVAFECGGKPITGEKRECAGLVQGLEKNFLCLFPWSGNTLDNGFVLCC